MKYLVTLLISLMSTSAFSASWCDNFEETFFNCELENGKTVSFCVNDDTVDYFYGDLTKEPELHLNRIFKDVKYKRECDKKTEEIAVEDDIIAYISKVTDTCTTRFTLNNKNVTYILREDNETYENEAWDVNDQFVGSNKHLVYDKGVIDVMIDGELKANIKCKDHPYSKKVMYELEKKFSK